ncbi:hypothetical protein Htur_0088 [Haloterrigena turkmenica DSM 5511]|uniref:Glycyl aminopeptidase n=1 Tax=Haloterrigena turkmenica (strain ATCC 51198 / DSM 5511 / JCM 9101 / NCIMB 13204 / VKM B-1734 / 4k) TaxID=543526 RepID=D2RTE6_HALTV|nr:hypothetical protein Htur_0088 [Haloterrigena turkmenica DSM 5511]
MLVLLGTVPAGIAGAGGSPTASDPAAGSAGALESTAVSTATAESSAATKTDAEAAAMAEADDILHRTIELRHLPDRPDVYEAEFTFDIPEPMSSLTVDLEDEAEVQSTDGFEATDEGTYRWTGDGEAPSIRVRLPADRTGTGARVDSSRSGYSFVDTGEWGVVPVPGVSVSYRREADVSIGIEETVTVDGPGATGGDIAVFGPVTEYERTENGETIRLVVPEAADLHEDPDDILEALGDASDRLSIAPSDEEVFVAAVPSDADWGSRGLQYGAADAWVRADAPLSEASNVWLHEYVHVHQRFANGEVGSDAEWLVEGGAEYHAASLAYEQGLISFSEFRDHVERGERSPYADGVLAEPETWGHERTDYTKGALVYGELDRQLREATDGDRRLEDIVRTLNAQDERVTAADVLAALEAAGGNELRASAERYAHTTSTPEMWSYYEHQATFGQSRTATTSGLGDEPVTVDGREWERWDRAALSGPATEIGAGDVLAVPARERVTVPVALENVDDRAGTADATLQVDGDVVATERRVLEAGERATATLVWTPAKPGIYDVRVGGDRLTVYVRSTPSLTVTDLRVEPAGVDPGETVTATASVATADSLPAAGRLAFRTASGTEHGEPIALAPGETGSVAAELTFDDAGDYEISAGERTATVSVGGIKSTVESMPGFGVAAAAVALGLAVAISTVGRRRH